MDWLNALRQITPETARTFVEAARNVVDALLIDSQQVRELQTPPPMDYTTAGLSREAPPGGWISDAQLQRTLQCMNEAIAAEKWLDGMLFAVRALSRLGGTS